MARLDAVRQALDLLYRYVDKYQDGGRPQVPDDSTMDGRALLAARAEVEPVEAKLEAQGKALDIIVGNTNSKYQFCEPLTMSQAVKMWHDAVDAARAARGQS